MMYCEILKTLRWSLGLLAVLGCGLALAEQKPFELRNERLAISLGDSERGGVLSLCPVGGEEMVAKPQTPILFGLTLSKENAPAAERFTLTSRDAKRVQLDRQPDRITLSYDGLADWPIHVTCTMRAGDTDPLLRARIDVQVPNGLALEAVRFPIVTLRAPLTSDEAETAAVLGATKGGLIRRPDAMKFGSSISISQPGNMAAQFGCYYGPRGGFFTAAFDSRGVPKHLIFSRVKEGVEFSWYRPCYATGSLIQDFDIVMTTFTGEGGAPADWRDAADIYKAWAVTQPWCVAPYHQRADIPGWMKEGPAMVRFNRDWLAEPARIDRWLKEYWQKRFPASPLVMAVWGWEKIGNWVTPDYFPLFPTDAQFAEIVKKSRANGCHVFPWPSGYHWTLTYRKRSDGGFGWDDRSRFDAVARPHAVQTRDGKTYLRTPSWLMGGDTSCLCGSDPWTLRWWNDDICAPLTRRGCELIQVDQVVGGNFPACYSREHGHPPGPGLWQTENFAKQLRTMHEAMKKIEPDAVVCFEEPNEWFNHLVGIQDYRDCETPREWASVFNYLYHEYLPTFQSNPVAGDLVMAAHCLVDGQIPHLTPSGRDLAEPVLINGGFEPAAGAQSLAPGWDQVHGYLGVDWTGQAALDTAEKHGGTASLRLDNPNSNDTVQVSQNVTAGEDGLLAGKKYRLSAWLKTDHIGPGGSVNFAFLGAGIKSVGHGGRLAFPSAEKGWQKVSEDFTVPVGAEKFRIMIHIAGKARAWVDDVALEEILPDGGAKEVFFSGTPSVNRFMQRWVALYHGEGRLYLEFGRVLHPPRLECATCTYQPPNRSKKGSGPPAPRVVPAVWHNAFRAPDGSGAVVFANPTPTSQRVTLTWRGKLREINIPARDAMLIK